VKSAAKSFRGLYRPQLVGVSDFQDRDTQARRQLCRPLGRSPTFIAERTVRIFLFRRGLPVLNEIKLHDDHLLHTNFYKSGRKTSMRLVSGDRCL
jgi:hypothetical protein